MLIANFLHDIMVLIFWCKVERGPSISFAPILKIVWFYGNSGFTLERSRIKFYLYFPLKSAFDPNRLLSALAHCNSNGSNIFFFAAQYLCDCAGKE